MRNVFITTFIVLSFIGTMGAILPSTAHAINTNVAAPSSPPAVSPNTTPLNVLEAHTPINGDSSDAQYGNVMQKIMSLFAWLVGVAAVTLDYSVYYTVVASGGYVSQLVAVGTTWRILRDIGNIMLIFGFLAIGITTILNVDWYGGGKKMLPMLIVAAVFLNFSLFFSEAVIDVGNLFATEFYTQINGGHMPTQAFLSQVNTSNEGISNKLMDVLGLQKIYGGARNKNLEALINGNPWTIGFMGILLFIITAFVLFSLAFILIARFVILIFLIILAPIGFAGLAVPMLKRRADQWWTQLFDQTITAPILLLMLYIALAIITDEQFLVGSNPDWLGTVNNTNLVGFGGILLSFMIAMGLLMAVVIQTKNLSAFGASWATKTAGALTFGLTATAMRSTAGWGLQRASQGFRKMGLSRVPVVGRAISGGLDRGAKASFDIRGTGVLNKLPLGGVNAGEAQKGGFREWEKGKIKEREDYAKTLEGRSKTGTEKDQIRNAEIRGKYTETLHEDATTEHKSALAERDKQQADVKRLTAIDTADRAAGRISSVGTALREAQQNLAKSEEKLAPALTKLAEATKNLEKAKGEETRVKSEVKEATSAKAAQETYAKGLNLYIDQSKGGFLRGAVNLVNPQRNAKAAENIRKEYKKTKSEKDLDLLKEALKKVGEEKKPEAPAPAQKPETPK